MGSKVAIAILAAGRSTRMGKFNKLLSMFGNAPLVRLSVQYATASTGSKVIVVTGHMANEIREAVRGLNVTVVHNGAFASGMSSSVRAALQAVPDDCDGVLIHLADMPLVNESHMSLMIEAFNKCRGLSVVRATRMENTGTRSLFRESCFVYWAIWKVTEARAKSLLQVGYPSSKWKSERRRCATSIPWSRWTQPEAASPECQRSVASCRGLQGGDAPPALRQPFVGTNRNEY